VRRIFVLIMFFLSACAPAATQAAPTAQVVSVFSTPSAQPWLSEMNTCAQGLQIVVQTSNDPAQADISVRTGQPDVPPANSYQIGSDDLLIVTHRESALQNLTQEEARALFANPQPAGIQIWVFAAGDDLQQTFTREVMQAAPVSSLARLAVSPQQMSDTLNSDKNAVGLLNRRWKAGTAREIFKLPNVPVLAMTKTTPQGAIKELLACLQKK
jgi:hypothetical protein